MGVFCRFLLGQFVFEAVAKLDIKNTDVEDKDVVEFSNDLARGIAQEEQTRSIFADY